MVTLEELKDNCRQILKEGKVKYIIGYKRKNGQYMTVPAFLDRIEEVDHLVWDPSCIYNLVRYLRDEKMRKEKEKEPDTRPVGVIVKGCDSRAVNILIQENYITRDDVYIIGVSCEKSGIVDEKKLTKKFAGKDIRKLDFAGNGKIQVTCGTKNSVVPAEEILADRCIECTIPTPIVFDVLFGEKTDREVPDPFKTIKELESFDTTRKWEFWKEEMDKCIRCYACRSVCPMCYCDECVADSISLAVKPDTTAEEKAHKIRWVEKSPVISENFNYHLIRAMHLAGRCVDCGECDRVCPVDIPLRYLNRKMEKESLDHFGYTAGMEPEKPTLVSCFREDDPEEFIL
ncbi:MAG: 4Fe-4S dicluster domain-containing protein [Bacteroidales bacterium]|nr:MAG: 4Fe-4S dicluster domain-containing protein [Bacteroidales bacterium]